MRIYRRFFSKPTRITGTTSIPASAVMSAVMSAVVSTLLLTTMAPSTAADKAVVASIVPTHIAAELGSPRLSGSGMFRYFGLHIYDAQLWIENGPSRPAALPGEKFALDLRYARTLHGAKIANSSIDEIKKLRLGTVEQQTAWLTRMQKIFPDVKDGTHITGINIPGVGVRFYLDGGLIGEIVDQDFARAFFAIWLDPRTAAPALREALLAHAVPRQ